MIVQSIGEFLLTDANMKIPQRGKIFSINEGYSKFWDESVKKYVDQCKNPGVSHLDVSLCVVYKGEEVKFKGYIMV